MQQESQTFPHALGLATPLAECILGTCPTSHSTWGHTKPSVKACLIELGGHNRNISSNGSWGWREGALQGFPLKSNV